MKAYEQMSIIQKMFKELEPLVTLETGFIDGLHQVEVGVSNALREVKERNFRRKTLEAKDDSQKK